MFSTDTGALAIAFLLLYSAYTLFKYVYREDPVLYISHPYIQQNLVFLNRWSARIGGLSKGVYFKFMGGAKGVI